LDFNNFDGSIPPGLLFVSPAVAQYAFDMFEMLLLSTSFGCSPSYDLIVIAD
jgi:hypothetical protein